MCVVLPASSRFAVWSCAQFYLHATDLLSGHVRSSTCTLPICCLITRAVLPARSRYTCFIKCALLPTLVIFLFNLMLKVTCSSLYPELHCSTVTGYVMPIGRHKEEANDLYLGGTGFESQLGQRHLLRICRGLVSHSTKILGRGLSSTISNSLFTTTESFEHRETDNYSQSTFYCSKMTHTDIKSQEY